MLISSCWQQNLHGSIRITGTSCSCCIPRCPAECYCHLASGLHRGCSAAVRCSFSAALPWMAVITSLAVLNQTWHHSLSDSSDLGSHSSHLPTYSAPKSFLYHTGSVNPEWFVLAIFWPHFIFRQLYFRLLSRCFAEYFIFKWHIHPYNFYYSANSR